MYIFMKWSHYLEQIMNFIFVPERRVQLFFFNSQVCISKHFNTIWKRCKKDSYQTEQKESQSSVHDLLMKLCCTQELTAKVKFSSSIFEKDITWCWIIYDGAFKRIKGNRLNCFLNTSGVTATIKVLNSSFLYMFLGLLGFCFVR